MTGQGRLLCMLAALASLSCDGGIGPSELVSEPQPCRFVLSPAAQEVPAAGGTFSVALTVSSPTINPCNWTAGTVGTWITLTSPTSGVRTGTITYSVQANTTPGVRVGSIELGYGGFSGRAQLVVTQSGAP